MTNLVKRCSRVVIFAAILCASFGTARAHADDEPRDVSDLVESKRAEFAFPGASAVIIRDGAVVTRGVAGVRKSDADVPIEFDDRWHLGSCTKSMTATLVARLVEAGHLSWDLTIADALPELKDVLHEDYRAVTISDLLRNRGRVGQPRDVDGLWSQLWKKSQPPRAERAYLARAMLSQPARLKADAYEYSNLGFAIAGHMAEEVMGTPWETLMREWIFEPLGMTSAGFGCHWSDEPPVEPWPHRADGSPVRPGPNADNPPAIGPAGTVHATMEDWGKYVAEHLRGARGEDGVLLSAASYQRLHAGYPSSPGSSYAMGWGVATRGWAKGKAEGASGRTLAHSGSNTTWYVSVWMAPEIDLAVLCGANIGGPEVGGRVDRMLWAVLSDELERMKKEEAGELEGAAIESDASAGD